MGGVCRACRHASERASQAAASARSNITAMETSSVRAEQGRATRPPTPTTTARLTSRIRNAASVDPFDRALQTTVYSQEVLAGPERATSKSFAWSSDSIAPSRTRRYTRSLPLAQPDVPNLASHLLDRPDARPPGPLRVGVRRLVLLVRAPLLIKFLHARVEDPAQSERGRRARSARVGKALRSKKRKENKGRETHSPLPSKCHSSSRPLVMGSLATTTCGSCSSPLLALASPAPPSGSPRYCRSILAPAIVDQYRLGASRPGVAYRRHTKLSPSVTARLSEFQLVCADRAQPPEGR